MKFSIIFYEIHYKHGLAFNIENIFGWTLILKCFEASERIHILHYYILNLLNFSIYVICPSNLLPNKMRILFYR